MTSSETPRVESFVLRFVADAPNYDASAQPRGWHGVIVHVQNDEEKHFTNIADAIAFIARYVPVGDVFFENDRRPPTDDRRGNSDGRPSVGGNQDGET